MINIGWIKSQISNDDYILSQHANDERIDDKLSLTEVEEAISNGSILELYEGDSRGSSCLIVGFTDKGKPIHIVCGKNGKRLIIITVYIPTPPKFKNPFERSK